MTASGKWDGNEYHSAGEISPGNDSEGAGGKTIGDDRIECERAGLR